MTIKAITTKEVVTETEIATPQFWRYNDGLALAGIYSEDKVIQIAAWSDSYASVTSCKYEVIIQPHKIFEGEQISEEEFNAALAKSIAKIRA